MASASKGARDALLLGLLLLGVMITVAALQWFAPERSVQPVAERFMCEGIVEVSSAPATREGDIFSRVYCVQGMRREDITNLTLVALAIPCALAVAAGYVLVRRVAVPKPKTRMRRATA